MASDRACAEARGKALGTAALCSGSRECVHMTGGRFGAQLRALRSVCPVLHASHTQADLPRSLAHLTVNTLPTGINIVKIRRKRHGAAAHRQWVRYV